MATIRYVVNKEPMDIARLDIPAHIGIRDALSGYGTRCLLVECGGSAIEAGIAALRAVYPDSKVFADRHAALITLRADAVI